MGKKSANRGNRFAELAVALGLLTKEQAKDGLAYQSELKSMGMAKLIGELLVGKGFISRSQVQKILAEQKRLRGAVPEGAQAASPGRKRSGELAPGMVVDNYQLVSLLGKGAMGIVYKAQDAQLQRYVALKFLSVHKAAGPNFIKRFQREVKAAGTLNHINIVAAFGAGETDGVPYLAMELIDGETLDVFIKKKGGRVVEAEALSLVRQAALGLSHAHSHGLIHRDVKPSNMLIDRQGVVKLMDLGLAKSVMEDETLTKTGSAIGTPHYMPPEQARGEKEVDERSDIYSLGVMLYQFLSGGLPFAGGSAMSVMQRHVREKPSPVNALIPNLSAGAVILVEHMMEKDPEDRPASAQAVVTVIDSILGGTKKASAGAPQRIPAEAKSKDAKPKGGTRKKAQARKRGARKPSASGSGCMLLVAAMLSIPSGIVCLLCWI